MTDYGVAIAGIKGSGDIPVSLAVVRDTHAHARTHAHTRARARRHTDTQIPTYRAAWLFKRTFCAVVSRH